MVDITDRKRNEEAPEITNELRTQLNRSREFTTEVTENTEKNQWARRIFR